MKKIIASLLLVMALSGAIISQPAFAEAVNCPEDAGKTINGQKVTCCGTAQTSINFGCKSGDTGADVITSMMVTVVNFIAAGVGIAVVGGIVWGALRYASANGNAAQAQQGVTVIVNAVIGLVLFILMYALVNFLVPGGVLS